MGLFGPEKITMTLEKYNFDVIKGTVSLNLKSQRKQEKWKQNLLDKEKKNTEITKEEPLTGLLTYLIFQCL
jgi:hypothetical protein